MRISAVLLAGGESRRMGRDKATLIWEGEPLWQRQIKLLQRLEPAELFVSARNDPSWRPGDALFVRDVPPSRGPLTGLIAALGRMKTAHVLALAVDLPFMDEPYLRSLCDQIEPGRGIIPMMNGLLEPLAAIYPAEVRADFAAASDGLDFSLQALTKRLIEAQKMRVRPVSRAEEEFFHNLNSPEDFSGR